MRDFSGKIWKFGKARWLEGHRPLANCLCEIRVENPIENCEKTWLNLSDFKLIDLIWVDPIWKRCILN